MIEGLLLLCIFTLAYSMAAKRYAARVSADKDSAEMRPIESSAKPLITGNPDRRRE